MNWDAYPSGWGCNGMDDAKNGDTLRHQTWLAGKGQSL